MARPLRAVVTRGDAPTLRFLAAQAGEERWPKLIDSATLPSTQRSLIHLSLYATYDKLNDPTLDAATLERNLEGHAEVFKMLLTARPSILSLWCPLVDAVWLRLLVPVRQLLEAMSDAQVRECLTERNAYGQTVLHGAAAAQASGVARRALAGGSAASLAVVGRTIDVVFPPEGTTISVPVLNRAIGQTDLHLLLEAGRRVHLGRAWLEARDRRGRTALHYACRAGRTRVVQLLLRYGAPAATEEPWGGTCGHLAASRGFADVIEAWRKKDNSLGEARDVYGRKMRDILRDKRSSVGSPKGADISVGAAASCEVGGASWNYSLSASVGDLSRPGSAFAIPPVRTLTAVEVHSREEFVRDYESISQPVLLSKLTTHWAAFDTTSTRHWSFERLRTELGSSAVSVGPIPYHWQSAARTTVEAFLREMSRNNSFAANASPHAPPPFIFENGLLDRSSLADDLQPDPDIFQTNLGGVTLKQLSISPPLGGAHAHFHQSTFNILVRGLRRWSLRPPAIARFELEPALHHFRRLFYGNGAHSQSCQGCGSCPEQDNEDWIDVIQHAGEVLYIPPDWQHSTLSLADSVAVAVEFV
ncbi:hypothetical protein AB1Y20_020510 [Prymnesium parvum]|uniref:JmjC domain-containing protein n=1 Tax=Prymnesium parvum TaxID=97485 RepID=A0AB34JUS2_PRYPA